MENETIPFFVRRHIHDKITMRLDAFEKGYRQNLGLVGHPGSGKTLVLGSLYQILSEQHRLIPVYIHARALDMEQFLDRWCGAVLSGLFAGQSIRPGEQLSSLLNAADPIVPQVTAKVRAMKKSLRKEKSGALLRECFALLALLSKETDKKIILMIDEFQELESLPTADPFALLGREIMVAKDTLFLVTSSKPSKAGEIFHDKLSLLFGNFEVLDVPVFGFREAYDYMEYRLPEVILTQAQKDFVIRLTNGHLHYLDLVCERIMDDLPERLGESANPLDRMHALSDEAIVRVFEQELCIDRGRIGLHFQGWIQSCERMAKNSTGYVKTLLAIAHGNRKSHSIAGYIERKIPETNKILLKLLQEELLRKAGTFYLFTDPLFSFWLKEVFEKTFRVLTPDEGGLAKSLRAALYEQLETSKAQRNRDIPSQIKKLFKEFRNDIIHFGHRKVQCPQFGEIQLKSEGERFVPLFAKSQKMKWFTQIAHEPVSEEDIGLFLDELKRTRKHYQRKILIYLLGIEQNAKLLAQESKVQLWDLRDVNMLLEIYELPKIILIPEKERYGTPLGALA